ncbi:Phage terminase, large subunit [Levilactobacillus brevis]|uniref:PBSX family phage terminase large subunit n=1 Tax=Levilactobacillus brevis TaxID=1580 RepID=UPI00057FB0D8|nr:PBSX family phage terminase large subunit [Levilactobacillus brevis]KID42852.1 Phage terminase, large subunit [Levilactobacillus brevis]
MNQTTASEPTVAELVGKGYGHFWNDKHFYRVVKGSRGSKKSKTTALNFISRIMQYPWANLLVIRRYSNTNRQSTYSDLCWAISKLHADSLFKCNSGLPEITYMPTGQKILLRGLDDPLKITSISVQTGNLCFVWIEEAFEIENASKFDTVMESIRGTNPDPNFFKQVTLTFNPWSEQSWLKKKFWDKKTRYKDVFAQTTTFRCNEWLGDDDRKRYLDLYRTNPRRAKIVCDGDWGVAEGLVFENFVVEDFDVAKVVKEATGVGHGMDFGYTHDPSTFAEAAINLKTKDIYVFGEMYKKGMLTDDIVKWVEQHGYTNSDISADCAEARLIAELRAKGVRRIHASQKGRDSVLAGVEFLQGFKIHILPSCIHAIQEFNTYVFDQDKNGNWLNQPVDANNHFIDALRYALERYIIPARKRPSRRKQANTLRKMGLV